MTIPYQEMTYAAPERNPGDESFFEAAKKGELLLKHCGDCGETHYYPRALCPHCMSDKVQWQKALGEGVIYTFSVTRRAGPIPYVIAYVTLKEGVTMMTHIVDCDIDSVRIGQQVRLVYKPTVGDVPVACFTPV